MANQDAVVGGTTPHWTGTSSSIPEPARLVLLEKGAKELMLAEGIGMDDVIEVWRTQPRLREDPQALVLFACGIR
jgi:hypothetical protein